jgi:hypothetical protein
VLVESGGFPPSERIKTVSLLCFNIGDDWGRGVSSTVPVRKSGLSRVWIRVFNSSANVD